MRRSAKNIKQEMEKSSGCITLSHFLFQFENCQEPCKTPEGSAGPENPIRLPSNVHYNQAEFS
ncbi:hypothetical protein CD148_04060 [Staphylococcus delphini]|uniref:Uncharacterized protein n=1 Tax=Staphylococcus delphini TaxID=53344 RepID=A0AAX0QUF6_9STAP|nr:hypothetical protein B5C07_04345 [Staphylococcus delphini]PNZ95561.1 hypothetical protein CD148_04060 [Staphylococcus delphini]RIZ52662.1 hypothetical protein CDL68_08225 [Staphylococcus delphini]